ncbi:type II restriction endonuclease [Sphingobacteriales bacterium UPWRP_1]|nr:type II restriction endonuclease [Sphingobacteriales bacterium UPWRP_1]
MYNALNLQVFDTSNLFDATHEFFEQLGIKLNANNKQPLNLPAILSEHYKPNDTFEAVQQTFFAGIINDTIFNNQPSLFQPLGYSYIEALQVANKYYNGLMVFALRLNLQPTRTHIAQLTRAFNRISLQMPVALLILYPLNSQNNTQPQQAITLSLSERFKFLQPWRQGEKAGKVMMLRDMLTKDTHTGHLRILQDLVKPAGITTYEQLHQQWLQVLDVNILNQKFYRQLASWYFTALKLVAFPNPSDNDQLTQNADNLIRLITRLIFVWFLKEKNLVPNVLFNQNVIAKLLRHFDPQSLKSGNYYNAILQNLFFATLNKKIEEREFILSGNFETNKKQHNVTTLYRFNDLFTIEPNQVLELFKTVPFLNGGLFDCLDKRPDGSNETLYVDGFSRNVKKRAIVPDALFFGKDLPADTTYLMPDAKTKSQTINGIIHLLNSYKFTITENTPIEEEIALDPELLGKVFEELLASYNPNTQTTARKQTGSFYTPREIVDYMADETLINYLKNKLLKQQNPITRWGSPQTQMYSSQQMGGQTEMETPANPDKWEANPAQLEDNLRILFDYHNPQQPFDQPADVKALIEALHQCKIIDPACGSGAFPMGILHKMVFLLQKLDPNNQQWRQLQRQNAINETKEAFEIGNQTERELKLKEISDVFEHNNSDYGRKLYLIENCIYGIDLQPIAVQIAKLRFFISLVIDQKVNPLQDNFGVRSLPNLETKFVAANTLIPIEEPKQLGIRNIAINKLEDELKKLRHEYFSANQRNQKRNLQKKEKQLRQQIADLLVKEDWSKESAQKIAAFDPYDQNTAASWFNPEWMFAHQAGFDIVIGNPPYIQLQSNGGKLAKTYQNLHYHTFTKTGDIYTLFYEKGVMLLKPGGLLCYITSNKWMRAEYGKKTRQFFAQKTKPLLLIDMGSGVFKSATVDTNILLLQNTPTKQHRLKALDLTKETSFAQNPHTAYKDQWLTLTHLSPDALTIASPTQQTIKNKMEKIGKPLKNWDIQINRGILTGYNQAFIIDTPTKESLCSQDPRSAHLIKPILRGRDIKRYQAEWAGLWLINTHNGVKGVMPRIDVQKDYPAIYQYLLQFEKPLQKRQDKGDHWTNLRNCAYLQDFQKEKIIYSEIVREPQFYYDDKCYYPEATVFIMTGKSLKYLTAMLHSKCVTYGFKKFYAGGGLGDEGYRYKKVFLQELPIPPLFETEQQPFIALVEQIIAAKQAGKDTAALEQAIDNRVYKLYQLTYEEVLAIDPQYQLTQEEYNAL